MKTYLFISSAGVLSVNPKQDDAIKAFVKTRPCQCFPTMPKDEQLAHQFLLERQPCEHQKQAKAVHFYLRPSQHKFEVPLNHKVQCKLEIVKYAAPIEACINRQLINIVDQVNHY